MYSVLVIFILFQFSAGALKPDDLFTICKRKDPKLDQCIINSMNNMRPLLKEGIRQLKIQPLDPMVVSKISVKQGSGPVSMDSTFTNLKIHGMTNYELKTVTPDIDKYKIDFEATLPYLFNEGDYTIGGRILILPISGEGYSWSNYTGVTVRTSLVGSPVTKEGKLYMKVNDFKFDLDVKKAEIHMENLFNGNKVLGDNMNRFMKENWEVVFKELKPVVNEAVSALLKDVAVKVFDSFPLDQLFPE